MKSSGICRLVMAAHIGKKGEVIMAGQRGSVEIGTLRGVRIPVKGQMVNQRLIIRYVFTEAKIDHWNDEDVFICVGQGPCFQLKIGGISLRKILATLVPYQPQ